MHLVKHFSWTACNTTKVGKVTVKYKISGPVINDRKSYLHISETQLEAINMKILTCDKTDGQTNDDDNWYSKCTVPHVWHGIEI